jgi:hypothetical protein
MPAVAGAQAEIHVGEAFVSSKSSSGRYAAVFEDDGTTGYFYVMDTTKEGNQIVDAMHIYNVAQVTDKQLPSMVHLIWSNDGLKVALVINRYPHAVYDFEKMTGYCRTAFPKPAPGSSRELWDDSLQKLFQ